MYRYSTRNTRLSIIIVSWNTRQLLRKCLASIYTYPPEGEFELFVVDNASTDGSAQMVQEQFSGARLIENKENVGFARANNEAIRESAGLYVLLLNPDTEVQPGALETLAHFMEKHLEAGAAGAQILNPDGSLQPSCYPAPTLFRELWRLLHLDILWPCGQYRMANWSLDTPREVDALLGACLVLRREALDQLGLLDEDYFIYSEEIDLCRRLQRHGWRNYWVPQARVTHYGGQSTQQVAAEMFLTLYKGKVLYFRKHHGRLTTWLYKVVLSIAALFRLLLVPLTYLESPSRRTRHLTLARLYGHLLAALPAM
jgi:N-acetylglucosaminyl-diphospho-decaprenol L-rhamnosyltransferase